MSENEDPKPNTPTGIQGDEGSGAASGGSNLEQKPTQTDIDRAVTKALQTAQARWKAEEASRLEAERRKAEQEKLEAQGEYKRLYEEKQAELERLAAERKRDQFRTEAINKLSDIGLVEFKDILLEPTETVDGVAEKASKLKASIDALVNAEVEKRLSGTRSPNPSGTTNPSKPVAEWTTGEKSAYIREHGLSAWTKLVTGRG